MEIFCFTRLECDINKLNILLDHPLAISQVQRKEVNKWVYLEYI
jgi:hypothetical protein